MRIADQQLLLAGSVLPAPDLHRKDLAPRCSARPLLHRRLLRGTWGRRAHRSQPARPRAPGPPGLLSAISADPRTSRRRVGPPRLPALSGRGGYVRPRLVPLPALRRRPGSVGALARFQEPEPHLVGGRAGVGILLEAVENQDFE